MEISIEKRLGGDLIKEKDYTYGSPLGFLLASLKGISQVFLIDNAITGFIFLIAISVASIPLGIITLASAMIGTWIVGFGGANPNLINQGLFGYNSVLTGLALALFLDGGNRWMFALFGAAIAALFTASMMHVIKIIDLPVLTFPYILLTWLILLACFRMTVLKLSPDLIPQDLSRIKMDMTGSIEISGLVDGIGQVFFMDNVWSAIIILIGIFYSGWKLGLYALVGTSIAWITAYGLGVDIESFNMGIYGYNAVLTIIAISVVFDANQRYSMLTGCVAAILTVPFTASIGDWLTPYGIPALTMPFVLVTWIFLSMRKVLPNF